MTETDLLERAYTARLRLTYNRAKLVALREEFEEREDILQIKDLIAYHEEEHKNALRQALDEGIVKSSRFRLKLASHDNGEVGVTVKNLPWSEMAFEENKEK